jgi:hypothetical protein
MTQAGPKVCLPNNEIIQPTHVGNMPIQQLPPEATQAHVFPALKSASLVSIGQLCDVDCEARFRKKDLQIYNNKQQLILTGERNDQDGLWDIDMNTTNRQEQTVNAILRLDQTKSELAQYLYSACFSPTPSTFIQAINKGHFTTWPGLTADLIKNHLPQSNVTVKGHLKQEFKNLRSTKAPQLSTEEWTLIPSATTTPDDPDTPGE